MNFLLLPPRQDQRLPRMRAVRDAEELFNETQEPPGCRGPFRGLGISNSLGAALRAAFSHRKPPMAVRAAPAQAVVTRRVESCGHVGLLARLRANAKDFYRQRRAGPPEHQLRRCPDFLGSGERAAAPPDPRKRPPARLPGPGSAGRRHQANSAATHRRSPSKYAPRCHRARPEAPVSRQAGQAVPAPPTWRTVGPASSGMLLTFTASLRF